MGAAKQYKDKSVEELAAEAVSLRKAIAEAQFKHAARQLEDTASIRRQRRDLARVLTIQTQKSRKQEKK